MSLVGESWRLTGVYILSCKRVLSAIHGKRPRHTGRETVTRRDFCTFVLLFAFKNWKIARRVTVSRPVCLGLKAHLHNATKTRDVRQNRMTVQMGLFVRRATVACC